MIICAPVAVLHSAPDLASEQADEVVYGTECEILGEQNGFYRVRTSYGYEGYAETRSLCEPLHRPNMQICVPFADLLPEPKNFFRPALTLPQGALADVGFSETCERYGFLVLPSKRVYYIHKNHIKPIPASPAKRGESLRADIVNTALSYLGVQYRWGGRTHAGIDCSGLAHTAYLQNGIIIHRDSDISKSPVLKKIAADEAKAGDLFFFPGHMAVCLGDREFVHASASAGRVCRGSLNPKSPLYDEYLAANLLHTGTIF